jgi:hypothetical protein
MVEGGELFGDLPWSTPGQRRHHGAQEHPLGLAGHGAEQNPRVVYVQP